MAGLLACGGSGGTGNGINLQDLGQVTVSKVCAYDVRCGFAPDQATCAASTVDDNSQLIAYVMAGKVAYDGAAAATCLNAIEAASCNSSEMGAPIAACQGAIKGTVPGGGACAEDLVCESQSCATGTCDSTMTCCSGTCRAAPPGISIGGDCSAPGATCASGAYCDQTLMTCQKLAAGGEACSESDACVAGFGCLSDGQNPGICGHVPAHGEPCTLPIGCDASTDYCDPNSLTCMTRALPGNPCDTVSNGCVPYATCDSGTLKCVSLSAAGQPCTDATNCLGSLQCNNGVCGLPEPRALCP